MTEMDIQSISAHIEDQLRVSLSIAAQNGIEITREYVDDLLEPTAFMAVAAIPSISVADVIPLLDREGIIHRALVPFNVLVEDGWVLVAHDNHLPWLANRRKSIDWTHWDAYKQHLGNSIPPSAIIALDRITDEILDLSGDPNEKGPWDRRGLVMGNVQSGKTANYIGLINKAACAGYKVIIILAGLHNHLRAQTQHRVDEGITGRDSQNGLQGSKRLVGVGLLKTLQKYGFSVFTSADEHGDFNKRVAEQLQIPLRDSAPKIFVVKKNTKPLGHLNDWLRDAAGITGNQKIKGIPLLVIDDEADQASINTGLEPEPDDENTKPSMINAQIRKILNNFNQVTYIGYTATPFANIFQAMIEDPHEEFGEDLFPRSFIKTLAPPSNYFGPREIFGTDQREGQPARVGLPLVKEIARAEEEDDDPIDLELWIPRRHDTNHSPEEDHFPESLVEAIKSFILICAARLLREPDSRHHNSMLVHVTRYVGVQEVVTEQVENRLREIKDGLGHEHPEESSTLKDLQKLWEREFVPVIKEVADIRGEEIDDTLISFPFETIDIAAERITVKRLSGNSKDSLDYEVAKNIGQSVIAIGGDKLSRGLTLDGLSVSYYSRASRMYDTLMQMGRWFGYRDGYLDLCRLWTTDEIKLWYRHIATASEELYEDFIEMVREGGTPKEYGLRVRAHPEMMVTNRLKWKHAEKIKVSFSGIRPETTVFQRNPDERKKNLKLLRRFIEEVKEETNTEISDGVGGNKVFTSVSAQRIIDYLSDLNAEGSYADMRYPLDAVVAYIKKMVEAGGLKDWTVLLVSNSQAPAMRQVDIGTYEVGVSKRADLDDIEQKYVIKSLIDPEDEKAGLNDEQKKEALVKAIERNDKKDETKKLEPEDVKAYGREYRAVRPHTSGLIILYLLDDFDNKKYGDKHALDPAEAPYVGLCLSFPQAPPGVPAVDYVLNPVALDQR